MKQTNNAIKFLLAQYRAVFKSAYLKGLVSAVVLTTGLAAGAFTANAEEIVSTDGANDSAAAFDKSILSSNTWVGELTISGSGGTITATALDTIINADGHSGSLTVTGNTKELILTANASSSLSANLNSANINTSGDLTLDASNGDVTLSLKSLTLSDSGTVTLSGDSGSATLDLTQATMSATGEDVSTLSIGKSSVLKIKSTLLTSENLANVAIKATGENAVIDLTSEESSSLASSVFVDDGSAGLHFGADSKLQANSLSITATESQNTVANIAGTVSANSLAFNAEEGATVDKITVKSGTFKATDSLTSNTAVEFTGATTKTDLAQSVSGDFIFVGQATGQVVGGVDSVVQSGSTITIGDKTDIGTVSVKGDASGSASLTFNETSTLEMVSGSVTVSGNSADNNATLTLKAGTLTYSQAGDTPAYQATSIKINDHGTLNIAGSDLNSALNAENGKFGLQVSGSAAATANVSGNLSIAADKFVSNTNVATTGGINVGASGTLNVSGTLTINAETSKNTVENVTGTIQADNLSFSGADGVANIIVSGGNFTVKNNLSTNKDLTFSGSAPSTINLGTSVQGDVTIASNYTAKVLDKTSEISGSITLDDSGSLLISGTASATDAAEMTFTEGSILNLVSGSVTVSGQATKTAELDLSKAGVLNLGNSANKKLIESKGYSQVLLNASDLDISSVGLTVTGSGAVIDITGQLTVNATSFKLTSANNGDIAVLTNGKLVVDDLTINGADLSNVTGTIEADSLTFSGDTISLSGNAATTDLIQVNQNLTANTDITIGSNANLRLGANSTSEGAVGVNLAVNTGTLDVLGSWNAKNLTLTAGSLNVGTNSDKGNLTVSDFVYTDGTLNIASNSSLTAKTIDAAKNFTVNGNMTVTGKESDTSVEAGTEGYKGFDLTDKIITVSNATFTIGSEAAKGLFKEEFADFVQPEEADPTIDLIYNNFGTYKVEQNGTLAIEFNEQGFTIDQLKQMKKELFADGSTSTRLDIGAATVTDFDKVLTSGSTEGSYEVTFDNFKDVIQDGNIVSDKIASTTVTKVNDEFSGNIGAVQLEQGTSSLNVADNTTLINANINNDRFVTDYKGEVAGIKQQEGTVVTLQGSGAIKDVTLTAGKTKENSTTLVLAESRNPVAGESYTITIDGVNSNSNVLANTAVQVNQNVNAVFTKDVNVDAFTLVGNAEFKNSSAAVNILESKEDTLLTAKNLTINNTAHIYGNVNVTDDLKITSTEVDNTTGNPVLGLINGEVKTGKNFTVNKVALNNIATVGGEFAATDSHIGATGTVLAKNATLSGSNAIAGTLNVASGSVTFANQSQTKVSGVLTAKDINFGTNTSTAKLNIFGGEVSATNLTGASGAVINVGLDGELSDETPSLAGFLEVTKTLDLNGATLMVDPSYEDKASLVAINSLQGASKKGEDVGIFNGNVFVGQNAALGVGVSMSELQDKLSQFMVNGAFQDPYENDSYGAMLYLDKPVTIADGNGITLTAGTASELESELGSTATGTGGVMAGVDASNPTKANTIYFGEGTALAVNTDNAKKEGAYINFDDADGDGKQNGTLVAGGGDIVLFGDNYKKSYQLFDANIDIKDLAGLGIDKSENAYITVVSANGFLVGKLDDSSNGSVSLTVNEEKAGVFLANASTPVQETIMAYVRGYNGNYAEGETIKDEDKLYYGTVKTTDGNGSATETPDYDGYNNYFISQVILGGNAADVEKVARLGVYGGTAQAALTAGSTTYEAVAGRMGVGAQNGSITFADNGQGAGLWVTPVYKNYESDGFAAQGLNYGSDMDLYGVALGGDYTLDSGLRLGAAFNVGSGDADGNGAAAGVSNEFDYYGFTVYGGFTMDALSVVGDISYTVLDNSVEANTGVEKVSASMDSSNLSLGITAQYAFDMNGVSVVPHAGMRYTKIDMDDYTVKGSEDIAKYSSNSANIFSIPVGVTFAKDITSGAWTIKPALDLTLTANMGDDSIDGTASWAGVENLQTKLESEIVDSFTYGATLGVSAKSGNMSFGVGLNYTGASSADEYGVSANARFVF